MMKKILLGVLAFAPHLALALLGYCSDTDVYCPTFLIQDPGICNGERGEMYRRKCPLSCGTCSLFCAGDSDASCSAWAKLGECTSSPDYMLKNCPTSCGMCAPKCADLSADCNHWARGGQCSENPTYMSLHCPVTCGVCKGTCKDTHADCPGWAADGECESNPGHTFKYCPFSCGQCKRIRTRTRSTDCKDTNATKCTVYSLNDECLKNPKWMHTECAATCGVCTTVCEDKVADCAGWAADGLCEDASGDVEAQCPQSCGLCQRLENFYRTAVGGSAKEEA